MGFASHRIALGLAATAVLLGAAWFAATRTASNEVFAALLPADGAPTLLADASHQSGPVQASVKSSGSSEPRPHAPASSERVPVEDVSAARRRSPGSFFDLRGLGTLAGSLEIHSPERWPRSPEDSNLRLRIAPTTRIPEFELSGIFRGQLPLSTMVPLGEFDGVRRWSFDAGELPCGEYTLTVLPIGGETQVTIERGRESYATVSLAALEQLELHVVEDGRPYAALGVRYLPWANGKASGSPGGRRSGLVSAKKGGTLGTFVLTALAGEREVTIELGELGSLRRTVLVPTGGGRATVDVTRAYAIELWIEDEHGQLVYPRWAAASIVTVVAGSTEVQSVHSLARSSPVPAELDLDLLEGDAVIVLGGPGGPRMTADVFGNGPTPEAGPGPAAIWYFSGPGTVELRIKPTPSWGEPTTLTLPIGTGEPTRSTLRVRRPESTSVPALGQSSQRRIEILRGRVGR